MAGFVYPYDVTSPQVWPGGVSWEVHSVDNFEINPSGDQVGGAINLYPVATGGGVNYVDFNTTPYETRAEFLWLGLYDPYVSTINISFTVTVSAINLEFVTARNGASSEVVEVSGSYPPGSYTATFNVVGSATAAEGSDYIFRFGVNRVEAVGSNPTGRLFITNASSSSTARLSIFWTDFIKSNET